MPNKMLTAKQEKFCQGLMAGLSQSDSFRKAYPAQKATDKTVHETASRLRRNPKVAARLQELRAPVVEMLRYDLAQAMIEAQEAFNVSRARDNGAAMVAAVMLRARLNGLLVDRQQIRTTEVQRLSDEDLDRLIARKLIEAGLTPESLMH